MSQLQLSKNQKYVVVSLIIVLGSVASYWLFNKQPQVNVQGVSSASTTTSTSLPANPDFITPLPSKTIILGTDTSAQTRSQVLESAKTPQELLNFYKNYFYMQDWVLVDESSQNGFVVFEFRQGTKTVKITLSGNFDTSAQSTSSAQEPVLINVQEFF